MCQDSPQINSPPGAPGLCSRMCHRSCHNKDYGISEPILPHCLVPLFQIAEPEITSQKVYIQIYCLQGKVVQLILLVKAPHILNRVKSYISAVVLINNLQFFQNFYVPTQCLAVDALWFTHKHLLIHTLSLSRFT